MKTFIAGLLSTFLAVLTLVGPAKADVAPYGLIEAGDSTSFRATSNVDHLIGHGPLDGEFSAWTKVLANGRQMKFYAKYLEPGKKVQFLLQNDAGVYEQVAWKRVGDADLNSDGSYEGMQNHVYFIRTVDLKPGKNRVRIMVDGELYWGTKTYSFDPEKVVADDEEAPTSGGSSLEISAPAESITGNGDLTVKLLNLEQDMTFTSLCLTLDGAPVTAQTFSTLKLGTQWLNLDAQGCVTATSGFAADAVITATLNSTTLTDGAHTLRAEAKLVNSTEEKFSRVATKRFTTDNYSLNATAPEPTFTNSYSYAAGQYLTVFPGYWGQGVTFSYKWYSNGVLIRGATSDKYLLTQADVGRTLRVEVTGSKSESDSATKVLETQRPITEQSTFGTSQGYIGSSVSSFNVRETGSVYNSVTRSYEIKEINNYDVRISHPTEVICTQSIYSSSCSFEATASWTGTFDNYESFFEQVKLVRISDNRQVDYEYVSLSTSLSSSDTLSFTVYSSSLTRNSATDRYRLEISDAGYNQTLTRQSTPTISFISGPNTAGSQLTYQVTDQAVTASQRGLVYQGGTSQSPQWTLWQYATPTNVKVMQECAVLPIYLAPQSLKDGSLSDSVTQRASDATVTVYGGNGSIREKITINGSRGDWSNLLSGNRLDIKVCDLKKMKGSEETLRLQLDLRYDAFNFEAQYSATMSIKMLGNMVYTKINCYKGEAGMTINDYKPTCPEGWTETTANVENGKVEMTTLNCLKGRDLKVITAPEPECPAGYEVTNLKVKDGELVPWTIICRKGFDKKTITAVFPSCPAGYTRSY